MKNYTDYGRDNHTERWENDSGQFKETAEKITMAVDQNKQAICKTHSVKCMM